MGFLDIDNVTKAYGAVEVLHRVDISVEEGEFLVLVGPSGCGKSTLLNMIAGLEGITSGEIKIKERVVNGVHPSKRNIAMVFQSYALYPNMTVGQNITFGLEMHGVPKEERDQKMNEVAELLQIEQLLSRKPGQLSGGQRQRVAMGRALVREPRRVPVRRAVVEPRRQAARRHADRDQETAPEARHHHRLRDP
jgi:multiple sugar transport system ATP-binding protein